MCSRRFDVKSSAAAKSDGNETIVQTSRVDILSTPYYCVPMSAFGPIKNNVPEKLLNIAKQFETFSSDTDWIDKMLNAMTERLNSANRMKSLLRDSQQSFIIAESILAFRWYFHFERCCNSSTKTFAHRVINHPNVMEKGKHRV